MWHRGALACNFINGNLYTLIQKTSIERQKVLTLKGPIYSLEFRLGFVHAMFSLLTHYSGWLFLEILFLLKIV